MKGLVEVAAELQTFFETREWPFCFIGGLTVQAWGEPRLTLDVDVTILAGFGNEMAFIEPLMKNFSSRMDDAERFALERRVLLIESADGIGIDVSLGAFDFEAEMITRSVLYEFLPNISLRICTPEDLIVSKTFAGRPKDWIDVESVVERQIKLDWDYVFRQLEPLVDLKEAPELLTRLREIKQKQLT